MRQWMIMLLAAVCMAATAKPKKKVTVDRWPDGTEVSKWFADTAHVDIKTLGRQYVVTDFGVKADSTIVQTEALQAVIDRAANDGGGVVVIPEGTFLSGSLFFRQGTHLHIRQGGVLKGSDDIQYFPIRKTRMEGQTLNYFCALVNVNSVQGFTISGKGTINGNGLRYWREFWIRRKYNPQCTNLEAMRPRLLYISHSTDVTIDGVSLINSPFWTCHVYRSERVKILNTYIYAPHEPQHLKAPSSDAIDIDACKDVLINGCYMSVNDDAVALKGGKGTWADQDPDNGPNENIIIQNCHYGFVHACLTLGSESISDHNIVLRNIRMDGANRVLWLKMRPDTPQQYEHVTVDNVKGTAANVLYIQPWTQFFKPGDRKDMPLSTCHNITLRNLDIDCQTFFNVGASDKYQLKDFTFENLKVRAKKNADFDQSLIDGCTVKNVKVTK